MGNALDILGATVKKWVGRPYFGLLLLWLLLTSPDSLLLRQMRPLVRPQREVFTHPLGISRQSFLVYLPDFAPMGYGCLVDFAACHTQKGNRK